MKVQRKRDASQRPHKAAARHMTPWWKVTDSNVERLLINERRPLEIPDITHEAWPRR